MTTIDFITALFCRVDDRLCSVAERAQALLYQSELVTIGILYALKGCSECAFYQCYNLCWDSEIDSLTGI